MKNLFVFLFACCVQAVSAQNATWRFGASGANSIYERRVLMFIIYHNVH